MAGHPSPAIPAVATSHSRPVSVGLLRRTAAAVLVFGAISTLAVACSADRSRRDAWFDTLATVQRSHESPSRRVQTYDELAATAFHTSDRCQAMVLAASEAEGTTQDPEAALARWTRLLESPACSSFAARALFEKGQWYLHRDCVRPAMAAFTGLLAQEPDSYWARRAIEELYQHADNPLRAQIAGDFLRKQYPTLAGTRLAGHVLFYLAKLATRLPGGTPKDSIPYLLALVDRHPESPLWPDAVWQLADLLAAEGFPSDEVRLLEECLMPRHHRDIEFLSSDFLQRVRLRLAGKYERQGRYSEALYQLGLVVNHHAALSPKDDGLWMAARIHRTRGEWRKEQQALETLLRSFPTSRHAAKADRRLGEIKSFQ
jgi:tetratricopeptide (TPR) repeat protein